MSRKLLTIAGVLCCLTMIIPSVQIVSQGQIYYDYLDDRSTPESLMTSYFNAVNRKEYVRAYSYWDIAGSKPEQLKPFPQFQDGYANTQSTQLIIGTVGGGVAAGNIYYSVPVTLIAKTTAGTTQTFVGCYTLHLGQPAVQGAPPFNPLGIQSADVQQVANNADTISLMSKACANPGGLFPSPTPVADPAAIDASRYLDDRSDGVQVLRSWFNAVNRKEYARAYSYWDTVGGTPAQLPPFPKFQEGYANTESVQLITGTMISDVGAGQLYYAVPVTLISKNTNGSVQTFVGCYKLHLSQPAIQGEPPFRPLGIISAQVQTVANNADTTQLMQRACN